MKLKNIKFYLKVLISIVLCVTLFIGAVPVSAETQKKSYTALYNEEKVSQEIFADNDDYKDEYPNGLVVFPVVNAELKMDDYYAIEVYRMGGTKGEASVTVETVDYTAGYGIDYEIYLSNEYGESPVKGEAGLLYALEDFSFIPVITNSSTETQDEDDTSASSALSELSQEVQNLITPSSSFTLTFAEGENKKKIYVKTLKDDTITDDLEFIVNLKSAQGCEIGTQNSASFTIKEEREKPVTELKITDTIVNPDSEQAYVVVSRGGNMGTYGSYRVVTNSGSAVAGEDYEAVQMQLDFIPGMSEQKIPVTILDGAEDGEEFTMILENTKNATAINTTATVTFSDEIKVTEKSDVVATGAYSPSKSDERKYEYVPISNFQESTKTNRGTGTQKSSFTTTSNSGTLYYSNGVASKNNAISIRTKDKINFSGVEKVSMVIDNYTGSCSWDHNAIYISDSDKFSSTTGDYDWLDNLADDGVGDSWDMTNVSDGHIIRTTPTLTQSKVNGEHYLYIMMHKGAFSGECSFKIFSDGTTTDNVLLHLTEYNITIKEPDSEQVYKNGVMDEIKPASGMQISNPENGKLTDSTTIYRNETVTINGTINSKLGTHAKLKGIVFCDSGNTSQQSEVISLNGGYFTLTPSIIEKYSSYFDDNKIIIKPVYSIDTATVNIKEYNSNGQKVVKNSDGYSATVYNDNVNIGTISWTKSDRSDNSYMVGDELKFTFTSNGTIDDGCISIDYRCGSTQSDAQSDAFDTDNSASDTVLYTVSDLYSDICPYVTIRDPGVMVNITNPEYGSVVGATDNYITKNADKTWSISGYKATDGTVTDFNKLSYGSMLSVYADPEDGYRAKWTCNDSSTGKQKVYYGNSFFYLVQYALEEDDNNITLTFEKIDSSKQKNYFINGIVSVQEGSILNPPNLETDIYEIVPNASVTIDDYMGITDSNGEFYLETAPTMENSQKASVSLSGDETIRTLVMCNNQYYISDINVADFITADTTDSLTFDIKLDYVTYGPAPKSIIAYDSENNSYGDAITLATAKAIQFDLYLDLAQQDENKPINMVRWTVESEDGANYTDDIDVEENSGKCHMATILSEVAKPGMKMYVELFNKTTDSTGKNVYTTYGKFNTGYSFIALAVEESVTYAPDIGVPSTMALPAPCIGPINPTFSIFGLSPVFNVGSSGTDSQGRELKTVTIGLSWSALKNYAEEDPEFATTSFMDKLNKFSSIMDNVSECYNSTGSLPKFASGKGIADSLKLKTAIKVNISVALCYQGCYYVDEDSGEWMFVSNLVVVGFGGSFSVSVPFTFFYIPCFTYITFALNVNAFIGIFPKTDEETGSTVALTLTQLDDADLSTIQGVYEVKGSITFGLGIGFDGLVSASGSISADVDIQFNDFMRGVGNLGMSGGVTLELLVFKYTWKESFLKVELFNTLEDNTYSLRNVSSAFNEDLLNKVTLRDMVLETATETSNSTVLASLVENEFVIGDSDTLVSPSVIPINDGKYMITTIISEEIDGETKHKLFYIIYDEESGGVTEYGYVLDKLINDLQMKNRDSSLVSQQLDSLDSDVQMIDCGEDILITWTKLSKKITNDTDNLEILKAMGIASIYYNKADGYFHDYSMVTSDNPNEIYINPKTAYNSETGLTQMFYEILNLENVTLDTTIADFQELPTTLATRYIDSKKTLRQWSDESTIAISENALNYYAVESVNDKIVLAFIGSAKKGFTLEDISQFDYDDTFDAEAFNTQNSLYIQQFSLEDDKLSESQQIRITGDGFVSANPEFARINSGGVDNLLLFYKCNGLYAYQNINTLITQGIYTDENGKIMLHEDYLEPQFITDDEDYTVNDDFMIVSNDEFIYALWTTTEGNQQQIWARSFCIDGMDKVEGTPIRDDQGNPMYDGNGNVVIEKYDEPVYLLKGYWGGKTYLTKDGVSNTEEGMYKKNFDAVVMEDGNLLTVFNAFDMDYGNDEMQIVNNRVIMAKYETSSEYVLTDAVDDLMFSNSYPTSGEAISVESIIKNTGVLNGENVTAELYVNGEKYAENTYGHWLTAESKTVKFEYIMPENIKAEDVHMYVKLVENGETKLTTDTYSLKTGDSLAVENVYFMPVKNAGTNSDAVKYRVFAKVKNNGNVDYTQGKYLRVMETDIKNLTASMSEENKGKDLDLYTMYGAIELLNIKVGEEKLVSFTTNEIPISVFNKNAGGVTAYLEGVITDDSQLDKTIFSSEDTLEIYSEFFPGLTMLAQEKEVENISLEDLAICCGTSAKLKKEISPLSSQLNTDITYTSSDEGVAVVDNLGVVTAIKAGSCTITAEANGVVATANVTVFDSQSDVPTEPTENPTESTAQESTNSSESAVEGATEVYENSTENTNAESSDDATQNTPATDTGKEGKKQSASLFTGDTRSLYLWLTLAFISLSVMAGILFRKNNKKSR